MSRLIIKKKNEVFLQIQAEPYVHQELSDYFTFEVPEAKFLKEIPNTNTGMELFVCILLVQEICMLVYILI